LSPQESKFGPPFSEQKKRDQTLKNIRAEERRKKKERVKERRLGTWPMKASGRKIRKAPEGGKGGGKKDQRVLGWEKKKNGQ